MTRLYHLPSNLAPIFTVMIMATPADAIDCDRGFQRVNGQLIATPYCQDEYLAQVARGYGLRATASQLRNNPNFKKEICPRSSLTFVWTSRACKPVSQSRDADNRHPPRISRPPRHGFRLRGALRGTSTRGARLPAGCRRPSHEPIGRACALSGLEFLSHPWHRRTLHHRHSRVQGLHPHVQSRCARPLSARQNRYQGDGDMAAI